MQRDPDPPTRVTYREVKADILTRITRGDWPPGSLLPNEVDIAAGYPCARATVNRAMRELAEEGILERRRRAGTRVRKMPMRQVRFEIPIVGQEIADLGAAYGYRLLSRRIAAPLDKLALGDLGLHLTCLHFADGAPYQHEDRWISLTALPDARDVDFTARGPNEWLVETVPYSEAEISLSATVAEGSVAAHLDCAPGTALFRADRRTWWRGSALTQVALTFRPGHRMTTRY